MEPKVVVSKKFSLGNRDWWRSLVMAMLTPVIFIIQQTIDKGEFVFNWKLIAMTAISAGVAYLIKNFSIEPPKTIVTTETNTKAENASQRIKEVV